MTSCVYCGAEIAVGFWDYAPSAVSGILYCPKCAGRHEINRASRLIATATWMLVALLGVALAKILPDEHAALVILASTLLGMCAAALAGSRRPGLVKAARGWKRKRPAISDADRESMRKLGIVDNGQYFIVGSIHFDHLHEALAFARRRQHVSAIDR
ncbi:hypothetical protein LVB87_13520 [Lysobacter sp. KIS68-7]|uniref:hypothetical protein n=1 Tax=Lysobacter sp. KIS68-7 TaxID=2904252 RepID=UPI001E2C2BC9|nr:hypothetical protein [Lysobacter sp. KIS68-7]UHQ19191.1 hypothetical protein LVB87_13520 [Lysobacter sp. KIS68-7]